MTLWGWRPPSPSCLCSGPLTRSFGLCVGMAWGPAAQFPLGPAASSCCWLRTEPSLCVLVGGPAATPTPGLGTGRFAPVPTAGSGLQEQPLDSPECNSCHHPGPIMRPCTGVKGPHLGWRQLLLSGGSLGSDLTSGGAPVRVRHPKGPVGSLLYQAGPDPHPTCTSDPQDQPLGMKPMFVCRSSPWGPDHWS